jgi:organic radical activating enzyme
MKTRAYISEIFSSIQGEGLYVGAPMTFVRFAGCALRCAYCDTHHALKIGDEFLVESPPRSRRFETKKNPLDANALTEIASHFDDPFLSITGGEPLEQADFLSEWLTPPRPEKKILLETNGVETGGLLKVIDKVDIISMDIKLPSAGQTPPQWEKHRDFIKIAHKSGKELYTKVVISSKATDADIKQAIRLISGLSRQPVAILQPEATEYSRNDPACIKRFFEASALCQRELNDVRIVPQMHKIWEVI